MVIRSRSSRSITTSGAIYGSTMPALAAGAVRRPPASKPVGEVTTQNLAAANPHKNTAGAADRWGPGQKFQSRAGSPRGLGRSFLRSGCQDHANLQFIPTNVDHKYKPFGSFLRSQSCRKGVVRLCLTVTSVPRATAF